ncbi:hypothetical protein Bca52824_010245 [Brassica carinata]|uniref:Uncharacterized protein n=1 Tax=Brassica carinata TaxID=52824 RepID=A0A8X8BAI8_BRACI|nr:hypothetical protein Bca52824_010245 [Brassica carinata]
MELQQIHISKPDHDDEEETESPSRTEEVIPLSCATFRQEHCLSQMRTRRIDQKTKANSLAVMKDVAHLLFNVAGFGVSLLAIKISSWEANPRNSFGFKWLEVLAAFLSVQLIWLVFGVIIHEAIQRLLSRSREVSRHNHSHHHHHHEHQHCHKEEEIDPLKSGLGEKSPSKEMNINLQGAYLHAMADMIQSLGVTIGGGIIWVKRKWVLFDLLCTLVFSAFALAATLPMLKNIFGILIERAPRGMDLEKLERGLKHINGVNIVHDLHVWEITVGRIIMSCHVLSEPELVLKISFLMLEISVRNLWDLSCNGSG